MNGYFDGVAEPNPGPLGIGWVLYGDDGTEVATASFGGHTGTNNEAEYAALISLLRYIQEHGYSGVTIAGDSQLVVCQANGEWQCRAAHLVPFLTEAKRLLRETDSSLVWVRHDQNERADELSKAALADPKLTQKAAGLAVQEAIGIGQYRVKSASSPHWYEISLHPDTCSCPQNRLRHKRCKHIVAASQCHERRAHRMV